MLHNCKIQLKTQKPVNQAYPEKLISLGDHLRKVRLDRGLSQSQVAGLLQVTTDTVTYWEMNRCRPTAKFAKRIIAFLGYLPLQEDDSLVRRLQLARLISGMTLKEAAEAMCCDASNLRFIELGERAPKARMKEKIERFIQFAFQIIPFLPNA